MVNRSCMIAAKLNINDIIGFPLVIYQFLAFFLDESNLKKWIKDEWCKIYENSYVQVQLMSPILR